MTNDVRAIAFYLPQYHPIPENDAWWGPGFTEWRNVAAAEPQFAGHHQPQLPAELGFYDLRLPEVRAAQAALARDHGIHGFCYYRYWFDGHELLERPFNDMVASGQPDFPFCVCWANENWTRRWDGLEQDVLIAQTYRPGFDLDFIRSLLPALRDSRYIRIDGRPLVLVYRTTLLPDPVHTARIWRQEAAAAGLPGLYLARVESMADGDGIDPRSIGFDAAVEFPPNCLPPGANIARHMPDLSPAFLGHVFDYAEEAMRYTDRPAVDYKRFSGVMPAWDNTARRGPLGIVRVNSRPELYQHWLERAVDRTRQSFVSDERLVFINAWNEWGEGCHLEPDSQFGRRYLEATRAVLIGTSVSTETKFTPENFSRLEQDNTTLRLRERAAAERLAQLTSQTLDAERQLNELRRDLADAQQRVNHLEIEVSNRDIAIQERDTRVAERDSRIADRDSMIADRDSKISERDSRIAERDSRVADREARLIEIKEELSAAQDQAVRFRRRCTEVEEALQVIQASTIDSQALRARAEAAETSLYQRDLDVSRLQAQIAALAGSTSWRLTAPLRVTSKLMRRTNRLVRYALRGFTLELEPRDLKELGPVAGPRWLDGHPDGSILPSRWVRLRIAAGFEAANAILDSLEAVADDGSRHLIKLEGLMAGDPEISVRLPDRVASIRFALLVNGEPPETMQLRVEMREMGDLELAYRAVSHLLADPKGARRSLAVRGVMGALGHSLSAREESAGFDRWIRLFDSLSPADIAAINRHIAAMTTPPKFSIVVPVYNTPEPYLRAMLDSVLAQLYPHWELCLADDASPEPHVAAVLADYAKRHTQIKVVTRATNGHISAASNSALELATGDYIALLDHDDLLPPHALYMMAVAIAANPTADIFYSDEDKIDEAGRRFDPYFKSDWNRELLLSQNYISHFGVYRASLVQALGGFREGFEGSQDYDLVLRAVDRTTGPIVHVPWILYHWRLFPGAGTFSSTQLDRAADAARRAVAECLERRGESAEIGTFGQAYLRVKRADPPAWPKVSVVIPTRDHVALLKVSVGGVLHGTDYPDVEVIIADNDSADEATKTYFDELSTDPRVHVVACPGPFNFSRINNQAIATATGEIVVLLNNDIEVIRDNWLKELVKVAMLKDVGAVGAKLLYGDNTVQHGGVVLGLFGVAGHLQVGAAKDDPGYFAWLSLPRDTSAVTAACMAMRRTVLEEVGGFDAENLAVAFNDVDLCLRITRRGYRIVWTPHAELFHLESKSRGSDLTEANIGRFKTEIAYMRDRWGERLDNDPLFNPNLSLADTNPTPGFPPRRVKPWAPYLG